MILPGPGQQVRSHRQQQRKPSAKNRLEADSTRHVICRTWETRLLTLPQQTCLMDSSDQQYGLGSTRGKGWGNKFYQFELAEPNNLIKRNQTRQERKEVNRRREENTWEPISAWTAAIHSPTSTLKSILNDQRSKELADHMFSVASRDRNRRDI